jgi:hypothetical protein
MGLAEEGLPRLAGGVVLGSCHQDSLAQPVVCGAAPSGLDFPAERDAWATPYAPRADHPARDGFPTAREISRLTWRDTDPDPCAVNLEYRSAAAE